MIDGEGSLSKALTNERIHIMNKFLSMIALAMIVAQFAPVAASAHNGVQASGHARHVLCKDSCGGPNPAIPHP